MSARDREEAARKARADLDRQRQQSEKLLGPGEEDTAGEEDRVERLGRLVGRGLGYVLGAVLLWYLASTYVFK
ncbi:MAG: hypothetical protein AB7S41_00445 [Parvibaculaceae bacterium]